MADNNKPVKNIASAVRGLIEPAVNSLGYRIWDVVYEKQGGEQALCVTIDADDPEGIFIDDCVDVHNMIEPILDENDPIKESYNLQVSSPGLERELRTAEHFKAVTGRNVSIKLYNKKSYPSNILRGKLVSFENGTIVLDCGGAENTEINFADVSKANITIDFRKR